MGSSYYVTVNVTTTQGMSVNAQSNTFTVSIDTPTLGEATVVNNACDGYISVTSNLSGEYGGSGSGEIVSFETDSENVFSKLQVELEPVQEGSGTPSPSNVRPIRGHSEVDVNVVGKNKLPPLSVPSSLNGVTITKDSNGVININGTTTANTYFDVGNFSSVAPIAGTYILSGSVGGSGTTWRINLYNGNTFLAQSVDGDSPTPVALTASDTGVRATIYISSGVTLNNVKFYPMLRLASETDSTYEPYNAQTTTQDFNATLTPTSTDTTPYLFKAVGDVYGDRLEDKIVGGTVAWNQLMPNSSRNYTNTDKTDTKSYLHFMVQGTSSPHTTYVSKEFHTGTGEYSALFKPSSSTTGMQIKHNGKSIDLAMYYNTQFPLTANYVYMVTADFKSVDVTTIGGVVVQNLQFFDLTQMFGSTIADYIYSLEQATAGAGVAWFKKLFPNDYYEYNAYAYHAKELLSVEGLSAHVMRDADNNVIGNYPLDSSLTLRGIPKLDASNNLYYDGDEYTSDGKVKRKYGVVDLGTLNWTYVSAGTRFSAELPKIKTVANNDTKANIVCPLYVTGTPNDTWNSKDKVISANISSHTILVRDTAYTDATTFKSAMSGVMAVYELATPTTQTAQAYINPQIVSKYGTLEYVTNSIVPVGHKTTYLTRDIFSGYVDLISGKLVVDRAMVDLGSLSWTYNADSATPYFYTTLSDINGKPNNTNMMSSIYTPKQGFWNIAGSDMCVGSGNTYLNISNSTYTNATTFKSAMNGVQLVYELATPQTYQLTPQQVNTLVGTNNVWSKQGNIELSYHIPITNLLVKRQDVGDVSGGWLTLYSQPISQANDMDFTFIDFLNQYGKTYKYALVPLLTQTQSGVEVEVEGGYTVSNEVQSVFDGVFIADSTGSQKCKANVGYGNVDMNQVVGSITPIGAKYPIIVTNSHNQYHNGSISGTIVPDDYYFNGNLSRIDMVNKRNELEQFLTNKRVKVIKDWNGNIWLVMIVGNVSCTFNNNYGMGIVSFSTNWTEVGDPTNQQDLQATGLINVGGV